MPNDIKRQISLDFKELLTNLELMPPDEVDKQLTNIIKKIRKFSLPARDD